MAKKRKTPTSQHGRSRPVGPGAAARRDQAQRNKSLNRLLRDRVGLTVTAFAGALTLIVGMVFNNGYITVAHTAAGAPDALLTGAVTAVAVVVTLAGLVGLVLTVQTAFARFGGRGVAVALGSTALVCLVGTMFVALPYMVLMLSAPGMAILALGLIMFAQPRRVPASWSVSQRLALAAVVVVGTILALGLGMLDSLVWNPLAVAQGDSLASIYDASAASEDPPSLMLIIGWAGFWMLAAIIFIGLAMSQSDRITELFDERRLVVAGMVIVTGALLFQTAADAPMTLWLASTYALTADTVSPGGALFSLAGQLVLIATFVVALVPFGRLGEVVRPQLPDDD